MLVGTLALVFRAEKMGIRLDTPCTFLRCANRLPQDQLKEKRVLQPPLPHCVQTK